MRTRALLVLLALLLAADAKVHAGRTRTRTGQARSAEVLARRNAASPRGGTEWGGKAMAYIHGAEKDVRRELRSAEPGGVGHAESVGKRSALLSIREIVGKHLGMTPGQMASKDRRHERAIAKQLRRMLREVRTARSSGRPYRDAFPHSLESGYGQLEQVLVKEIAALKADQAASHRTTPLTVPRTAR
jgi:hypothetical protein